MTLPRLNFTSEKTINIPLHRAYWALLDIPFDGGSLDSSSSSLDDFSGLQRRRLSAFSLDDDPPAQRRISASSLDDPPTLLEPPPPHPKMTSSQSEQHLLAAETDTPETSAPSTPEPFASHQVKIPGNSGQEDAGGVLLQLPRP